MLVNFQIKRTAVLPLDLIPIVSINGSKEELGWMVMDEFDRFLSNLPVLQINKKDGRLSTRKSDIIILNEFERRGK